MPQPSRPIPDPPQVARPHWRAFTNASARIFGITLPVVSLALMLAYILS